jgi:hypothetical protein
VGYQMGDHHHLPARGADMVKVFFQQIKVQATC